MSPERKGWGEGETKVLGSLYPASWWGAVLGPAALGTRPGQAKAEKPGSVEERTRTRVGAPGMGQGPWWGRARQGWASWAWSGCTGLGVACAGLAWPQQA